MPLPDDTAPGRAHDLAEQLGRVTVVSPAGVGYAVRVTRRQVVLELLLGAVLGSVVGSVVVAFAPWPPVVPLSAVLGAVAWTLRTPLGVMRYVDVDRFGPSGDLVGAVARVGVTEADRAPQAVDEVVAWVRSGRLDGRAAGGAHGRPTDLWPRGEAAGSG